MIDPVVKKSWRWWPAQPVRADGRRRSALSLAMSALSLTISSIFAVGVVVTVRRPASIRDYALGFAATLVIIWGMVGVYLGVSKPSFNSRWTLILPTASGGVSLQLETIGHAQSVSSSPFGSSSLSPKVIYKEIIGSEQVRLAAAQSLDMKLEAFGSARVKLIDETSLMLLELSGGSADLAQRKANALLQAFHNQLDALRRDEIQRRAVVVQESLKSYEANLLNARERILAHQKTTGVLSINQFNETSTSLEQMRRRVADVKAEISRLTSEQARLSSELGIDPRIAAAVLRLSADPSFSKLASEYADSGTLFTQDANRMGAANPMLSLTRRRAESAGHELRRLAMTAGFGPDIDIEQALVVMNGTHRSDLVRALVASEAAIAGKREESATLEAEFARLGEAVKRMSVDVARLEDLKKDHLVAEAVFTSALARLDTNKVDIYSSYPMVQTLAAPDLPAKKSSPSLMIAILGGVLASMLSLGGWGLAWLRMVFRQKRVKPA